MEMNVCVKDAGEVALGAAAHEVSNKAPKNGQSMEAIGDNAGERPPLSFSHPDFGDDFKYLESCSYD